MQSAEKSSFLKSFFMIIIYFTAVFYFGLFVSGVMTFFALKLFEISNPELFIQIFSTGIICLVGGIDFYLSFKGKWSPVSFILSIPIYAVMLLKAFLQNSKDVQFNIQPPRFNGMVRFNGMIKEISKIRFH